MSKEQVLANLEKVRSPDGTPLPQTGKLSDVVVSDGKVMLSINVDQVFSIGTVNGIMTPVVVGPKVRNVPKEGYWAWDPGGFIGLYKPDTFWLTQ